MQFGQDEIENIVMEHFKTIFDDKEPTGVCMGSSRTPSHVVQNAPNHFKENEFEDYVCSPYTYAELEEALRQLPDQKAAGTDTISNELLKNTSVEARLYIQTFVNKILTEGEVPESLNKGKCVLIYKVPELKFSLPSLYL